ncbi:MAG: hypothetical protein K2G13_08965, partial [Muribaculaceae bacterium]|nr:hypothetical protein [Muribaculaceae bacterium]
MTDKDSKQPANKTVQNMVYGEETTIGYKVLSHDQISKIEIEEENLTMGVGEVKELHVTLKNSSGKVLDWETYYGQIDVTKDLYTDICKIYKDYTDHTIKIEALGDGEAWPRLRDADHPDDVYDNVHVKVCSHSITKEYKGTSDTDVMKLTYWQNEYFEYQEAVEEDIVSKLNSTAIGKYGGATLPKSFFIDNNVNENFSIILTIDKDRTVKFLKNEDGWKDLTYKYKVNDVEYSSENGATIQAKSFELLLDSELAETFRKCDMIIHSNGDNDGFNITGLKLKRAAGNNWKSGARACATEYLVEEYKTHNPGNTKCDAASLYLCDENHDFSKVTPIV